jgi:hypothetical protein
MRFRGDIRNFTVVVITNADRPIGTSNYRKNTSRMNNGKLSSLSE